MNAATLKIRKIRLQKLDAALKKLFPHVTTELKYKTPWQFMVAVQLSAQCTDRQVNKITPELFKKYKTLDDYVRAGNSEKGKADFERMIHSCTYSFNKTRNILGAAKIFDEKFGGKIPKTMHQLLALPGVGRKTANVFLTEIHNISEGITVDTHVIRFVRRFDLSDHRDAVKIERDLMQLLPKAEWPHFTHRVIHYGRYIAPARRYDTSKDPLVNIFPPAANRFRA